MEPTSWRCRSVGWSVGRSVVVVIEVVNVSSHSGKTYLSAFLTPDHMAADTGGINLKLPTGGDAYGMPRYASTGSKWRPSNCTITPDKAPLRVWIIRDESCEGNWSC